jgi:hypothetical protein
LKQKLFFKDATEVFKSILALEIEEISPQISIQTKLAQFPTSPPAPRNFVIPRRHPAQSPNVVNLWFQLFSNILGDDPLMENFLNTLYLILGNEGTPKATVRRNLPEKNTQRIQRRKVRT